MVQETCRTAAKGKRKLTLAGLNVITGTVVSGHVLDFRYIRVRLAHVILAGRIKRGGGVKFNEVARDGKATGHSRLRVRQGEGVVGSILSQDNTIRGTRQAAHAIGALPQRGGW